MLTETQYYPFNPLALPGPSQREQLQRSFAARFWQRKSNPDRVPESEWQKYTLFQTETLICRTCSRLGEAKTIPCTLLSATSPYSPYMAPHLGTAVYRVPFRTVFAQTHQFRRRPGSGRRCTWWRHPWLSGHRSSVEWRHRLRREKQDSEIHNIQYYCTMCLRNPKLKYLVRGTLG